MLPVQSNYGVSVATPLLHKKLVFCPLLRHLRAEKGMHRDQDNLYYVSCYRKPLQFQVHFGYKLQALLTHQLNLSC